MALNKLNRCSTCLRPCSVTLGHNPILLQCGHHTCSRCHQTQWLRSGSNDSEGVECVRCTLATLSEQSSERHDMLMNNSRLLGMSDVGELTEGARKTRNQVESADNKRPCKARKDTCTQGICPQYHRRINHHRNWSCPANITPTKTETEWNSKHTTDMTLGTRGLESDKVKKNTANTNKGLSSISGEVPKFTPLDPKKKHHKKSKKNHQETNELRSPKKLSNHYTVDATDKIRDPNLMQPTDSESRLWTFNDSAFTNAPTLTHDQDSRCGQNFMDENVTSDDHSLSTSRSRHKHKHSQKKSKKKNKEKNRTKSKQDSSLTEPQKFQTESKEKEVETTTQLVHVNTQLEDSRKSEEEKLFLAENNEEDKLSMQDNSKEDKLSTYRKTEKDTARISSVAIAENGEGDVLYSSAENKLYNFSAFGDSEGDRFSISGNDEDDKLSINLNDGNESGEVTLERSPCMSLYDCASSTRFSSPISLDEYQLNNLLEDKYTSELEVQNWDSDKDDTTVEYQNFRDHESCSPDTDSQSSTFLCDSFPTQDSEALHKSDNKKCTFDQESISGTVCCKPEPDIIVNRLEKTKGEKAEISQDRESLDGSVLDRSGILYYDPIEDSDEDRLIIASGVVSEASLGGEEQTTVTNSNTNETLIGLESKSVSNVHFQMSPDREVFSTQHADSSHKAPPLTDVKEKVETLDSNSSASLTIKREDESFTTLGVANEMDSQLVTTAGDHDRLLQLYQQFLTEKSNDMNSDTEEDNNLQSQEKRLVKGFQESYTTSLICSQLANKALKNIKESKNDQKGPYQLSAKMLTGVLNILVQQANLASSICSELLNNTEDMEPGSPEISNVTPTQDNIPDSVTHNIEDSKSCISAETGATENITLGNISDISLSSSNSHSSNASVSISNVFKEEVEEAGVQSNTKDHISSERNEQNLLVGNSLSNLKVEYTETLSQEVLGNTSDTNVSSDKELTGETIGDGAQFNREDQICSERSKQNPSEVNFSNLNVDSTEKLPEAVVLLKRLSPELSSTIPSSKLPLLNESPQDASGSRKIHRRRWNKSHDTNTESEHNSISTVENNSKSTDKSSLDFLSNNFSDLDNKQQAVRSISQTSIGETYDFRQNEICQKNSTEHVNHSSVGSFVNSKPLDIPRLRQKGKEKKNTIVEKDTPKRDLITGGKEDEVNVVVSSSQPTLCDLTPVDRKAKIILETGNGKASQGTQVTEAELEAIGHKPDRNKGQTPENLKHRAVKNNKHHTSDKKSTSLDKKIDKDREANNDTNNQQRPPKGKRNLFDSIVLESEGGVVESPCKYRKLQFGKLPQSHAEDDNKLDTQGSRDEVSVDTTGTISLSQQKSKNGGQINTRHVSEIKHKNNETPPTFSNKPNSSTKRRSSSVPTSHRGSDSKDRSKSRSRYHFNCCNRRNRDSSSHHKSRGSERKSKKGPSIPGGVYVIIHGSKRDVCIQTDLKNVHQTPCKSKRRLDLNQGDTVSQPNKATYDASNPTTEGTRKGNESYSVNGKKSKSKETIKEPSHLIERESARKNKETENLCDNSLKLHRPTIRKQNQRDFSSTGRQQESKKENCGDSGTSCINHCDDIQSQSLKEKFCDEDGLLHEKTEDVNPLNNDHFQPDSRCNKAIIPMVQKGIEENVTILTPQDETCRQRNQARDEEIFACLSFSDSDDDTPLAVILDNMRRDKREYVNTASGFIDLDDDQLPKLATPKSSKHVKKYSHRRSRCDRPGLTTYLKICNSIADNSTDNQQCSGSSEITWRNSLMPPPLEAVLRSKSRENATNSTSTGNQALTAPSTNPSRSVTTSGNVSSESTRESDPDQIHMSDYESDDGNKDDKRKSFSSKKKKRHRRKKSEKPVSVLSSSSEECIPQGRKRGFQWRQECLRILDRVYNHHLSEPFRHEVRSRDIPDYYKIVKRGMCFDIIGYKLRCNIYEELRDFFLDVRLVFDNCRLYYKPEDPIYRAGLVVKYFFRRIAKEVLMPRTTAKSKHPS